MKSTDNFKKVISDYLQTVGDKDPLFSETLQKENKNIDDCINYILNEVKKSGCNGFEDVEIFQMAIHYYDEDDIKPGTKVTNVRVVTNKKDPETESSLKDKKESKSKKRVKPNYVSDTQISMFPI